MAGSYESTLIIGNVGKDCELRYTQSGVPVASFSVAVTSSWVDKATNEKREATNWYKVTCWRALAEVAHKYVKKGMSVMVQGTCEASAYMGQDGQPRASLDLTARDVQFLTRADGSQQSSDSSDDTPPSQDLDSIPF